MESKSKQIRAAVQTFLQHHYSTRFKSEDLIASVQYQIGSHYIFGDTILRMLRLLREECLINYECKNKKDRVYVIKKVE